jgi:hypothetical protein
VVPPPDFTLHVVLYGLSVLGVFGALWIYYDRRDRAFYDRQRRKISFHCIRCDHLYTERPAPTRPRAPNAATTTRG